MPTPSRTPAQGYSAILRDDRVSHGAFRLWHCLADHRNKNTGLCCPGQRTIAAEIGCDIHSLKGWTDELTNSGWLAVNPLNRGFNYVILDGLCAPLWKPTTT